MGDNSSGQLGDGTTTQRNAPEQILSGGVHAVAGGLFHSLILKTDGSLWVMGNNSAGQLGDGTTTQHNAPEQILPGGVQAVAAGANHSLILKTDGSLWAMGDNLYGQLGDGTTTARNTPERIAMNVQKIAAGEYHSLIVASGSILTVLSDQAFLQQLFLDVLGRPIDAGGAAAYGAALAGGESRAAVLGDLMGSAEYGLRQIEPVIRLYYAAFARVPDYAGAQNWSNALHAGVLTLTGAADQFAGSAEFILTYGSLDNTGYVQQLYRNVLGREADPAGLANWVNLLAGGASRGTVLVGFSESLEFQANMADQVEVLRLYYLLLKRMPTATELSNWIGNLKGDDQTNTLYTLGYPSGLSDTNYVQLVFSGFLRRAADPGALSSFGGLLTAGTLTHAGLVDTLLGSAEFNQYVGAVSRLYLAAFRRGPDAAGLDNWVNYMRAGNALESVADAFVVSQEFQLTYGSLNGTQYVTLLYENVLGREPDPTGLATWTGQLGSGSPRGQILIGFSESQEGIALFAPTVRTFLHYFTFLNTTPTQSDLDCWKNNHATLADQMREDLLADPAFTNGA
jgi:hypothetical protein